jgi:peroxin-19
MDSAPTDARASKDGAAEAAPAPNTEEKKLAASVEDVADVPDPDEDDLDDLDGNAPSAHAM